MLLQLNKYSSLIIWAVIHPNSSHVSADTASDNTIIPHLLIHCVYNDVCLYCLYYRRVVMVHDPVYMLHSNNYYITMYMCTYNIFTVL